MAHHESHEHGHGGQRPGDEGHGHAHGGQAHGDEGHDHDEHAHGGGHGGPHGHSHSHGHSHALTGDAVTVRMLIAMGLNLSFVAIEATFGLLSNSVALLADAGHNFGDVLGLSCACAAVYLGRRPPGGRFTYGLGRSSLLAALANAVILLMACGAIALEAIGRIASPPHVAGATVVGVAAVGIVLNGVSAWLLHAGSHGDLNRRSAYLHMLGDAAVSAGVLVSGALILFTGMSWLDPAVSLLIVAVILVSTWRLLRDAVHLSLDGVPAGVSSTDVLSYLAPAGRHRCARPSHLGAFHDQRRTHRASGGAGSGVGRCAARFPDSDPQGAVSHRPRDAADRARPLRSRVRVLRRINGPARPRSRLSRCTSPV
jgi:cobalt-zinc-cadmium efflux system protein